MTHFSDQLAEAIIAKESAVCVGIDPDVERMPPELVRKYEKRVATLGEAQAVALCFEEFARGIIEAVADAAVVVKPQVAFFEQYGAAGWHALQGVVDFAHERGLLVIADMKRGDVPSTSRAYARAAFGGAPGFSNHVRGLQADAITVSPYLGEDSLEPFTAYCAEGKGVFVLVRTSNPGASILQENRMNGRPLFVHTAEMVARLGAGHVGAHGYSDVGAVAGATAPEALAAVRAALPQAILLIPGYGTQGGDAEALAGIAAGDARGYVVNASRSVIYAWQDHGGDWRQAAAAAAGAMRTNLASIA